jgi:hypothetical protein
VPWTIAGRACTYAVVKADRAARRATWALVENGVPWEPYCLSDPAGGWIGPASEFLRDLQRSAPNEQLLAGGGPDGTVRLWTLASGDQVRTLDGTLPKLPGVTLILSAAFSPDGRLLAGGGMATEIPVLWLWDPGKSKRGQFLIGHAAAVLSLAFSPDGRLLASSGADGTIVLWDPHKRGYSAALPIARSIPSIATPEVSRQLHSAPTVNQWPAAAPT